MIDESDQGESYDAVPYDSLPLHPTHPNNLAVVAHFAGVEVPPLAHCRVLELGCASGGNLVPMAVNFPEGRFVGLDLSPAQIADGQRTVAALGLTNVTLGAHSIMDVSFDTGTFDFVICHGVYSWVPPEVQTRILEVCARVLAPKGLAYVSYNTYPGWHLRGMVRDLMLYHTRDFTDPRERVAQARGFLDFLEASARDRDSAYTKYLGEEIAMLRDASDSYLFHEHLERDNRPLYFHEFVDRVRAHGLEYLGEAVPSSIKPGEFPEDVEDTIRRLAGDVVQFEQYLDFLRNRMFRRSVLCRSEVAIDRTWQAARVASLYVGSPIEPVREGADLRSAEVESFEGPGGVRLSASHPWLKTALGLLGARWPEVTAYRTLEEEVAAALGDSASPEHRAYLREALLRCYVAGIFELHVLPSRMTRTPGHRPLASPLARLQARTGRRVTSLRHRVVEIRDVDRHVLMHLDGEHDRGGLAGVLDAERTAGLEVSEPSSDVVEESLTALGRAALLLS